MQVDEEVARKGSRYYYFCNLHIMWIPQKEAGSFVVEHGRDNLFYFKSEMLRKLVQRTWFRNRGEFRASSHLLLSRSSA